MLAHFNKNLCYINRPHKKLLLHQHVPQQIILQQENADFNVDWKNLLLLNHNQQNRYPLSFSTQVEGINFAYACAKEQQTLAISFVLSDTKTLYLFKWMSNKNRIFITTSILTRMKAMIFTAMHFHYPLCDQCAV